MYRSASIGYRMADAVFRSRRLFFVTFLVVSVVTMGVVYTRSKTYTATALTQVVTDDVASALGEKQDNAWISPAQKNVNQLTDLLNGDFLAAALNSANLQHPINTDPRANDPRFNLLKKKLTPFTQGDDLFGVELTWDNAADAEAITQAVQTQYIQEIGQEHFAQSNATIAFLDSQIASYAQRLRHEEGLLTSDKANNAGGLPEAENDAVGQLSALQAQLDNLKITSHDSAAQKAILEQQLAQIKPQTVTGQTSAPSPLQMQLGSLEARRQALLVTMLPTHPLVMALSDQIAALQKTLQAQGGAGAASGQITRTTLEDNPEWQSLHQQLLQATIEQQTQAMQMQQLAQKVAQYTAMVRKIPAMQRTLTDRTRDYSLVQAQYDTLLQRREQVQMEANLARVSASSSLTPIGYIHAVPTLGKAKMAAMLVGSLFLALVLSLLLVVLAEWADHSLRYGDDAERLLGLPVLGIVPYNDALFQPKPLRHGKPPRRGLSAPARANNALVTLDGAPALGMNASAMEGTH